MIRETLHHIGIKLPEEKMLPLKASEAAEVLRRDAPNKILNALQGAAAGLIANGSPGAGQWADVPWIALFDPSVTESATQGYYVVYLFSAKGTTVYLSLNQGATAVQEEFKSKAFDVLQDRAKFIRNRLSDFLPKLNIKEIDLNATTRLSKAYEAGHAIGKRYDLLNLPSEDVLNNDLQLIVKAYRTLTFRGGISLEPRAETFGTENETKVTERRRMVLHEKIERQSGIAKKVKKLHGTVCQACGLDMSKLYGQIGSGFIEAHHLIPLHTMEEGEAREYSVSKDFCVLCPNCHRMIHRYPSSEEPKPNDLEGFQRLLKGAIE
jgi:5-methylcytosine-specific restriction protein A